MTSYVSLVMAFAVGWIFGLRTYLRAIKVSAQHSNSEPMRQGAQAYLRGLEGRIRQYARRLR